MSLPMDDPRPPYLQVADALRADVAAGVLKPGQRLPSIRNLSTRFGVAAMTVQNALRQLRDDGITQTTPNRGSFVTASPVIEASQSNDAGGVAGEVRLLRTELERLADRVAALEESNSHIRRTSEKDAWKQVD